MPQRYISRTPDGQGPRPSHHFDSVGSNPARLENSNTQAAPTMPPSTIMRMMHPLKQHPQQLEPGTSSRSLSSSASWKSFLAARPSAFVPSLRSLAPESFCKASTMPGISSSQSWLVAQRRNFPDSFLREAAHLSESSLSGNWKFFTAVFAMFRCSTSKRYAKCTSEAPTWLTTTSPLTKARAAAEGSLLSIQSAASRAAVMISFFIWASVRSSMVLSLISRLESCPMVLVSGGLKIWEATIQATRIHPRMAMNWESKSQGICGYFMTNSSRPG
mmetsp:Transcript_54325/g.118975  ORF Transcript_54325/g.118975 Transcript_54325/m.118975 type:complete len:274 (-) Transcript_54325:1698-2519(-)